MIKILLTVILCMGFAPLSAQTPPDLFRKIQGFWKQLPPQGLDPNLIEDNYFEFSPSGDFSVLINSGTEKKPALQVTGQGRVTLLKPSTPALVEIILNDELSTNAIGLKDQKLIIYSFHETTKGLVEKIVMERSQKP